jgi:hypothetical protein
MIVIKQKWIKREDLQNNPNIIYLFGDNQLRVGLGGQAAEMRGEPNAVGIATKMSPNEFMSDGQLDFNKSIIDYDFKRIKYKAVRITGFWNYMKGRTIVVVPIDGLGTGLAELPTRAPKTYAYLCEKLEQLKDF